MSKVSFKDHHSEMGECYKTHSYQQLSERIVDQKNCISFAMEDSGTLYGYDITQNAPLSKLYGFPCYVVRFVFSQIETGHVLHQELAMNLLCAHLCENIREHPGYYNLRVPAHIVDLMKAVNSQIPGLLHCGGTMEELYTGGGCFPEKNPETEIFMADQHYIRQHREQMLRMAFDSFRNYSGQYHISPVTEPKAGDIYKNWIRSALDYFEENTILVADRSGETAGFHLSEEDDRFVEGVLVCVDQKFRGQGVYKSMIAAAIQYARGGGKTYVTSTQLDNYVTQGTWGSLGMRQLYAIYNLHFDNR